MGKQQRFSRRDFLKFGAVGAAGAAAAGIVGCAQRRATDRRRLHRPQWTARSTRPTRLS
ncbi:MAG: twin-arginine translocation signal domain-containing protein [Eggerthellaceae bacterium]